MLDVLSAILTIGFYPNVCYHKEKRKVIYFFFYYVYSFIFFLAHIIYNSSLKFLFQCIQTYKYIVS